MTVQSHLETVASNLVLSSTEKSNIESSINTLNTRLYNHFGSDIIERFKFGSFTRETILPRKADENSDVDYMIVFKDGENYKPQTLIDRLKNFAEKQYSTSEIHQSHPTVILSLNHIKFDLVPSYKTNIFLTRYYIPAPKNNYMDWIQTDPNGFNESLTTVNKNNKYLIKPTIRLVKFWNARNNYIYNSFDLENALVNRFYMYLINQKDYFFSAIENLSEANLASTNVEKVKRAKQIIENVKYYEKNNDPDRALNEIKKIVPEY